MSNLVYDPEQGRTHEQIVDEALLRERLWVEGGDLAVRKRVEAQLRSALADPSVPEGHHTKTSARQLLEATDLPAPAPDQKSPS